jgi:hypothetical protein
LPPGWVLLWELAFNSAGDLFESDNSGNIYRFTPDGVRSTFASALSGPSGLDFDSAGNLFVAAYGSGSIYQFTPEGVRSTFVSGLGLSGPRGLAFQPVPEPSIPGLLAISAAAFLVRRRRH